jgi:hypothetical protein
MKELTKEHLHVREATSDEERGAWMNFENWLFESASEFVERARKALEDLPFHEEIRPRALKNGTLQMKVDTNSPHFKPLVEKVYREWGISDSSFKKYYEYYASRAREKIIIDSRDIAETYFKFNDYSFLIYYSRGAVREDSNSRDSYQFSTEGDLTGLRDWLEKRIARRLIEITLRALNPDRYISVKPVSFLHFLEDSYDKESMNALKKLEKQNPEFLSKLSRNIMFFGYVAKKMNNLASFSEISSGAHYVTEYMISYDNKSSNRDYVSVEWKVKWKEKKINLAVESTYNYRDLSVDDQKIWKLLANPKNYKPVSELVSSVKNLGRALNLGII